MNPSEIKTAKDFLRIAKEFEANATIDRETVVVISDYINQLEAEVEKYHKELLKSKVFKFVRNPNRIYSVADFRNDEILKFFDYPEKPNALAQGYYNFKNKDDIRLLHISEVKELSYAEVKSEIIKEFTEKLKERIGFNCDLIDVYEHIDNIVKEMVGDTE